MKRELPPKPPRSNWTDEQWEAIHRGEDNILVAAGAGSGKTRVLVERIIKGLLDEENPVDIDRLLVVTFTNAAAAEMRQRIANALAEAIRKNPGNLRLRRQMLLLNRAPITTLHSFCREVLRTYHYLRDLDPAGRILDDTEGDLLRQDLVEEVLEDFFSRQEGDKGPFFRLVEAFSPDRGDQGLQRLILQLYNFSRSHPQPEKWLAEKAAAFTLPAGGLADSPWFKEMKAFWKKELTASKELLQRARQLALSEGGPEPYLPNLTAEIHMLARAEAAAGESWQELAEALQEVKFASLKPCRGDAYEPSLAAAARELRDGAKKTVKALKETYFMRTLEEQETDIQNLKPLIQVLVDLVVSFAGKYREAKEDRNVLDFSDLEHHALKILAAPCPEAAGPSGFGSGFSPGGGAGFVSGSGPGSGPSGSASDGGSGPGSDSGSSPGAVQGSGSLAPSQAALYYRQRFKEVLVDEYQDINEVQEAILKLLSRPPEEGGNLFMVGDVKQSIYRFRLAEPGLFLEKYARYKEGETPGHCIDLSKNFRSRREVLSAVNYLFHQLMDRAVGEIDYVKESALVYGAPYPSPPRDASPEGKYPVEVLFIAQRAGDGDEEAPSRRESQKAAGGKPLPDPDGAGSRGAFPEEEKEAEEGGEAEGGDEALAAEEELEKAALEGRLIARKIRELTEPGGARQPAFIFDKSLKEWRPLAYRDIVILLRSTDNWAPSLLEELQRAGIPAYAELGSGYFASVEVEVMLSLMKIIDNPYQDIPLAAVLRSPLVGLEGEELARVRTAAPREAFFQAVKKFSRSHDAASPASGTAGLQEKTRAFLTRLREWQRLSREGALADLIWQIYGETGYYELVGGMPGGGQRQANLRALYDRARQYENTSYRGLLRFLRFVEKLRERGGDLGVARALGEQEDVVRVMTIHKSKGLEFPVVFIAGLGKQFNQQDLRRDFLLHKSLGFGPRFLDTDLKVSYPTLPHLALREKLRLELLAEEMRILYVALTRAEERLYLVAGVKDMDREARKWALALPHGDQLRLPARSRSSAKGPLDWLGPALLRHENASLLRERAGVQGIEPLEDGEKSRWSFRLYSAFTVAAWGEEDGTGAPEDGGPAGEAGEAVEAGEAGGKGAKDRPEPGGGAVRQVLEAVKSFRPLPLGKGGPAEAEVDRRLRWQYPYGPSTTRLAKMSVSEIKKRRRQLEEEELPTLSRRHLEQVPEKPRFLEQDKLTAVERGTAYHTVMQYLDLRGNLEEAGIRDQMEKMLAGQKITPAELKAVEAGNLAHFFAGPLGRRLLKAREIRRELAFSLALPAGDLYPDGEQVETAAGSLQAKTSEDGGKVLIQGVLDCLFRDEKGLVLVDYKTDRTAGLTEEDLKNRYREQLEIYSRAVADIWQEEVVEKHLYFFDGGLSIPM